MTRSERSPAAVIVFALCLLALAAAPARAAEHDEAGARVLFGEGRRLADAGQYEQACLKFEESLRLDPGVGTSFNLADCQEHTGRVASAWARFLDVAAATKLGGQLERERVARARAAALEPRLPRLSIEVSGPPEGLVVERDGVPVGAPAWGIAVPVDPGPHVVAARAAGYRGWSARADVPDGPTTIVVSVPALEALPASDAPPALASAPATTGQTTGQTTTMRAPPPPSRPWSRPVVVIGALGVVGLAAAAVFGLAYRSANEKAKGLCINDGNVCGSAQERTQHNGLVDDARWYRTSAYVSAGVGAAALLTATYLTWRRARAPADAAGRISLAPLTLSASGPAGANMTVAW